MLDVNVGSVSLIRVGQVTQFNISIDLSQALELIEKNTHLYALITLKIPIVVENAPETMVLEKQFLKVVEDIDPDSKILENLILEWPGEIDYSRLDEILAGKASIRFYVLEGGV